MAYPVPGHPITNPFGVKGSWAAGYHTGSDIACPVGTRVVAMAPGRVIHVGWGGWDQAYGIHVVVQSDGVQHGYCHLSSTSVQAGQSVSEGQLLGLSGNTGRSTGPHVHVEERVSPFGYFNHRRPELIGQELPRKGAGVGPYRYGKKNYSIKVLQEALIKEGFKIAAGATGVYGEQTVQAVRAYQRKQGWSGGGADGVVGAETLKRLGRPASGVSRPDEAKPKTPAGGDKATPMESPAKDPRAGKGVGDILFGARNKAIVRLQEELTRRGFAVKEKIPGLYGDSTANAVQKFQRAQGWEGAKADGIVGPATLELLGVGATVAAAAGGAGQPAPAAKGAPPAAKPKPEEPAAAGSGPKMDPRAERDVPGTAALAEALMALAPGVSFEPGWDDRKHAGFGGEGVWEPRFVMMHHTAGVGPGVMRTLLETYLKPDGSAVRAAHFLIDREGVIRVLFLPGVAYHAGKGSGFGVPDDSMNRFAYGIEVESMGTEPDFTNAQKRSAGRLIGVLLRRHSLPPDRVINHRDWAGAAQGKTDTLYDRAEIRSWIP